MFWEKYIGKFCFYFGFNELNSIGLGFEISSYEISFKLIFISFGYWR